MRKIKAGLTFFFTIVAIVAFAQSINSPYSRFGLGELHGRNVNTTLTGMGGISIGVWNPGKVNPGNPASYGTFDSLTFLFEIGINGNIVNLKTLSQSESSNYVTLSYILTGFPVTRWWRTSLGILPYSKIGYDVNINIDLSSYDVSNIVNSIKGDGGLNQFYWGNGFNIGKRFRAGFDAIFIYGQGSRSSLVYFPDSLSIFGTKKETKTLGSDIIFDYGLQYDIPIRDKQILTLGAVYSNAWNVNAKRTSLTYTLAGGFDDIVESIRDTIDYQSEEKGNIVIPDRFGLGFMFKNEDFWLVGADFEWQHWNKFSSFGASDSLDNAWRFSIGGQITPKHTSISSLLKRMTYRLGFRYVNSYLSLLGHPINEYGISFGFTFPMKKSKTTIDVGVEAGGRGTTDNNLIKENFVNFTFGVSIAESWFYKRKYR
jgi:hypothetical protein